jgi:signal peptidase II
LSRRGTWAIVLAVFALDRATKALVERSIGAFEAIPVIPGFFNLVYTRNRGAAFGLFADSDSDLRGMFLIGVSAAVLAFLIYGLAQPAKLGLSRRRMMTVALSLIVGGAVGNLYDRLTAGSVTDFLQFFFGSYEFPSFNVADSAITAGCGLVLIDALFPKRKAGA